MSKFVKLKPSSIQLDPRFQRELDEHRAKAMAKSIDRNRIGVPVVSRRADGTHVALDGQHRISALVMAGLGDEAVLCEIHEGLTLREEAELFLKLNGGRTAVRVYDKFKARLVAHEPAAIEIKRIVEAAGLRIMKAQATNGVCAIQALEYVHHRKGNLAKVLQVLKEWSDGDPGVYEGMLIKDVAAFLAEYPDAHVPALTKRLEPFAPERVLNKIKREQGTSEDIPRAIAACRVFREIYNHRNKVKLLPPGAKQRAA